MSDIGKIFIYEKEPSHLKKFQNTFNENGFFTFGTDNLYLLLKYAQEINPDIIIINLPSYVILNNETLTQLENNLCNTKSCPQIYINYNLPENHKPQLHKWDFASDDLTYEQIIKIIKHSNNNHNLN